METDDPFVREYDDSELKIAAEFLTNWLPFLTRDLCDGCAASIRDRIRSLDPERAVEHSADDGGDADRSDARSLSPEGAENGEASGSTDPAPFSPKIRMSWADMAQEDELEMEAEEVRAQAAADAEEGGKAEQLEEGAKKRVPAAEEKKTELSREQREYIRFTNVVRKKDFICLERVKGKIVNVLEGLELHTGVFSTAEQKRIVDYIHELQDNGRRGELGERTYSEPEKWMRGKGRVTIQFGCCYNYAMDREGNPPGILRNVTADPIPPLFKVIIRRLVRWHVLPPSCIPDSCIVNIYEPGDCIPPHIDSHDFVRPFCTISFMSECSIVFGSNLNIIGPGNFVGSTAIPLPVGSVLVLNGNGADVAKHCVPGVPQKRISITFRRMGEAKRPFGFQPEPDLRGIQPLAYDTDASKKKSPHGDADSDPVMENISLESQHSYSTRRLEPRGRKALPRDVMLGKGRRKPTRVVVNGRSVADGSKAEEPTGGSREGSTVSDLPGILPLPDGAAEVMRRSSSHPVRAAGRTVSVEQKRIVIRSYLDDREQESPSSLTFSEPPGNPRFHGTRSVDRRRRRVGLGVHGVVD